MSQRLHPRSSRSVWVLIYKSGAPHQSKAPSPEYEVRESSDSKTGGRINTFIHRDTTEQNTIHAPWSRRNQRKSAQFGAIQHNRRNSAQSAQFSAFYQAYSRPGATRRYTRRCPALLGVTRRYSALRYSALLGATRRYSALLGATRRYPVLPGAARRYPALPGATRRYSALPGATRRYPALPGATRRYSALLGATRRTLGATRRYPALPADHITQSRFPVAVYIYIYIYLFKGSVPRCILKYGIFRCSKGVWDLVRTLCSYPKPVSCLPSADILGTPTVDDINPALPIIRNIP